eukprot:m.230683 g.230683  ORF g.230683 m.230683 type:complete len:96 (+) comp16002_c0_seq3:138-425(+)
MKTSFIINFSLQEILEKNLILYGSLNLRNNLNQVFMYENSQIVRKLSSESILSPKQILRRCSRMEPLKPIILINFNFHTKTMKLTFWRHALCKVL